MTEHPRRIGIWKHLARLCGIVKLLLIEEPDEPDGLGEILARLGRCAAPELVGQVKGAISPGRVDLLREQPGQFETVRGAHLPELSREADGELRH